VASASISVVDRSRLADLEDELSDLRRSIHSNSIMRRLNELVGTDFSTSWRYEREHDLMSLVDVARSSTFVASSYFDALSAGLKTGEMGFLFTTTLPEKRQRNRPIMIDGARSSLHSRRELLRRLGLTKHQYDLLYPAFARTIELHERYQIATHVQLRTLLCEGPLVTFYVNTIQEKPFTTRQQRVYRAAIALLSRRNAFDYRLSTTRGLQGALDAALDALGRAAYILTANGAVLHANKLGIEALERQRDLVTALSAPESRHAAGFDTLPIDGHGRPRALLVTRRVAELCDVSSRIASELHLSDPARRVFSLVASGEATKAIATRLGVAENTVDYHLTRIYRRLGVRSRAELQQLLMDRILKNRA